MKKLVEMKVKGFTLVEMLVVLGIISLLLLLFVPNLSQQKDAIQKKGMRLLSKQWRVRWSSMNWNMTRKQRWQICRRKVILLKNKQNSMLRRKNKAFTLFESLLTLLVVSFQLFPYQEQYKRSFGLFRKKFFSGNLRPSIKTVRNQQPVPTKSEPCYRWTGGYKWLSGCRGAQKCRGLRGENYSV